MLISPENTFTETSRMMLDPIYGHHSPASLTQIINHHSLLLMGLPWWFSGKESACQSRNCGFHPWVRKIPWRRKWQPTAVFLLGKSHGQRSLAGYSSWDRKRVGHNWATEQQHTHMCVYIHLIHFNELAHTIMKAGESKICRMGQ